MVPIRQKQHLVRELIGRMNGGKQGPLSQMADGLGAIKTSHNAQPYLHPLGVDAGEEGALKSLPTRLSQGTAL